MGMFLTCGIATKITVIKDGASREDIIKSLEGDIDFNIYTITEDEENVFLEIKEEVFEKNAIKFIKEQLKLIAKKSKRMESQVESLSELENKSYDELINIAKEKDYYQFKLYKGYWITNDISYITRKYRAYADIIGYITEGKIVMEDWYDIFYYIRRAIIDGSKNSIKTAMVIAIIG